MDWVEGNDSKGLFHFKWKFLINPFWVGQIEHGSLVLKGAGQTIRFEDMNGIGFAMGQDAYCPSYQIESPCQVLTAQCKVVNMQKINFLLHY